LDLGAESTRPGAMPVSAAEELDRLGGILECLRGVPVPLSLDTSSAEVMREGLRLGVSLINDVRALQRPGVLDVLAAHPAAVCLMHMQGEPGRMQHAPAYENVVHEVENFLLNRARACLALGLPASSIAIDPGFGFGKDFAHNHALFKALPRLAGHGFPVLVGVSRKRMIADLIGQSAPMERDAGSLAAHVMALERGARILRVHAVKPSVDAVRVWAGLV